MGFVANVLTILIASPGDVERERDIATEEIHRWNAAHGSARHIVLSPIRWETHSTPQMGAHPQAILNKEILEHANIVVGIFWTRLGTPTPEYPSGSVEEITKHVEAGKLAMVYFSNAPVSPNAINQEQWQALQAFKADCQSKGLYREFSTEEQFRRDFGHHLSIELNNPAYTSIEPPAGSAAYSEPELSDDERELLMAIAGDTYGSVLHGRTHDGYYVQTSVANFGDGTPRGDAALQQALKRLGALDYIKPISNEMDEMTGDGFARADRDKARVTPPKNPSVSPKAAELLVAAAGKGKIMHRSAIGDVDRLFAGGKTFPAGRDQREAAEWREGLQELEAKEMIHARSNALYEVTAAGYRLAESLSAKAKT